MELKQNKPSIIVVTGPTACGKSRLALALAQQLGGELINADSVQVYRDFNIGSAKPSAEEMALAAHHLFSVVDPATRFDAGAFQRMAAQEIAQVLNKEAVPVIVGGTGFYIRSLLCGLAVMEEISDEAKLILAQREQEIRRGGEEKTRIGEELHKWLRELDEESALRLHPGDLQRIRRALLVKLSTGQSITAIQGEHKHAQNNYHALIIVINPGRDRLYRVIEMRVQEMLSRGLIEEVKRLRQLYPLNSHPFGAIGYRHVNQFLDGQIERSEMETLLKRDTRRFAKRQMTWWRNQPAALGWKVLPEMADTEVWRSDSGLISDNLLGVIKCFLERSLTAGTEQYNHKEATHAAPLHSMLSFENDVVVLPLTSWI
jgi:tRNA dimethylallyltransferase